MSLSSLAERCAGPNILPAFPGSWCEDNLPSSTRGWRPGCRRIAPLNLTWRRLSRPPSFCRPCPGAHPVPSTDGSSKGPELQRRPGSPWHRGFRDAKRVEELEVSASTEGAACEAGPTEVPKTLKCILWNALRGTPRSRELLNGQCTFWREYRPY